MSATSGKFGSRLGFIFAAAGSAIGLGNIWRFPYSAGSNGGAAFVLVYLGFVALIGVPVLLAELSLGRNSHSNAVGAFKAIVPDSLWPVVGGLGVLTGFGILSFYSVIAGWTISFLVHAMLGTFDAGMSPEQSGAFFTGLIANPSESIATAGVFLALTAFVVQAGVSGGIERVAKVLMPVFFVLLVVLAGRAMTLPGAGKGIEFLLSPDFSKITPKIVMNALGQALFSLSLGMGAMITYGGYLSKKERLPSAGLAVAAADTTIALLAGFIIFPALFAVGADPASGPGLVFVVLPTIFDQLPAGQLFAVAFYGLLAIAALTSTISLLEVGVAYFVGEKGWTRTGAVTAITAGCFALAIPSALSQGGSKAFTEGLGIPFLDLQNIIWGNIALSVGAVFISLFVGHKWGAKRAVDEMGDLPFAGLWSLLIKWVCPLAIAGVLVFLIWTGEYF